MLNLFNWIFKIFFYLVVLSLAGVDVAGWLQ